MIQGKQCMSGITTEILLAAAQLERPVDEREKTKCGREFTHALDTEGGGPWTRKRWLGMSDRRNRNAAWPADSRPNLRITPATPMGRHCGR